MGAFIRFVKDNLLKCLGVVILASFVLLFAFLLTHYSGKQLLKQLLFDFPFSEDIYRQFYLITGKGIENTIFKETSLFIDVIGTFSESIIKCLLMTGLARIFLYVQLPVNEIITSKSRHSYSADYLEASVKKPFYTIKLSLISIIVTIGAAYLGTAFADWINAATNENYIIILLVLIALYIIFGIIRSIVAQIPVKTSLRVSFFFNILPTSITMLGTHTLILYAYFSYIADGFSLLTITLCFLLLLWCAVSEFLCNELRRRCADSYMNVSPHKYPIRFSVFFASAFFYSAYSVMFEIGMGGKVFQNELMRILFKIQELPFMTSRYEGIQAFSSFAAFKALVFPNLRELLLFSLTVSFLQMLCTQKKLISWYFMQCSLLFTLTLIVYSLLPYAISSIPSVWLITAILLIISVIYFSRVSIWRKCIECCLAVAGLFTAMQLVGHIFALPREKMFGILSAYLLVLNIIFVIVGLLDNRRLSKS